MDQEKIGKFIATCRKQKNMTQFELGEILGVTEKSISNWENGRNMPDLSLFKLLCKALDISINDLLSGKRINKDEYQEKLEENIVNTIDYTNKKISQKNNILGLTILAFGILVLITALVIFKSESSWSSIYAIVGINLFTIGLGYLLPKLKFISKMIILVVVAIVSFLFIIGVDYLNVKLNKEPPRFAKYIVTIDDTILYDTLFYDVYRCNKNQDNEYFVIEKNKKYNDAIIMNYCK